jgi:hypothetical protein
VVSVPLDQDDGDEDDLNLSELIEDRGAEAPDDPASRARFEKAVEDARRLGGRNGFAGE